MRLTLLSNAPRRRGTDRRRRRFHPTLLRLELGMVSPELIGWS